MKIRSLLLTALVASTTFVACDKDDNNNEPQAPKSVTINLANVAQGARSAGGDVLTDADDITLNNYQIFFSDGKTLYTAKQANGTDAADQYINADDKVDGVMPTAGNFHFLPAAVNKVIIIGNYRNKDGVYAEIKATTEAALDEALAIADEQNVADLTLYDFQTLTEKTPLHDDGNPLYKAELKPAPRVARLFVKSFKCTFNETTPEYNDLVLNALVLNNFNTASTIATGTVTGDDVNNKELTVANIWDWLADKKAAKGFSYDEFSGVANTTPAEDETYNTGAITLTPTNSEKLGVNLYYHIFAGTTLKPQLVLQATGDGAPLYLPTVRFMDYTKTPAVEITKWEAGMVYEMDFAFNASDFSQPDKCIDITVTPVKWAVTVVTPEFK